MTATQSNIIPFAFNDHLVRVFKPNGEPWFVGRDVCRVLEIKNESQAMARLDDDEKKDGVCITDPMGREQTAICINEPGVFRLVFTSRKPEAEAFKRWLAHEVLPALRKNGHYAMPGRDAEAGESISSGTIGGEPVAVMAQKLAMIRESRLIHGIERARLLWDSLGLPTVPGGREQVAMDAKIYLKAMLEQPVTKNPEPGTPFTIMHAILSELDDSGFFDHSLRELGIRVFPDLDGFVISNRFAASASGNLHANQSAYRMLLHIPGARRHGPVKFAHGMTHRGVFIPAAIVDELEIITAH